MFKSITIIIIAFVYLCMITVGCSSVPYRYSFSLTEPLNETMSFEDENIQFGFVPSSENIQVSIKNKTDHEINLVREKAEYIDPSGKSHMVHYGYDYVQEVLNFENGNRRFANPMRIGPGTEINGYVWINTWPDSRMGEGASTTPITSSRINNLKEPLFPRHSFEGRDEDLKGSTFNLVLPIDFGGYVQNYNFTFMINDVLK